MAKLLKEHRRALGDFEVVQITEESQADAIRDRLDVDCPTSIRWNDWEYGSAVADLRALYEKGKRNQWNATDDLDWDTPVCKDDWIGQPEASLLANTLRFMDADEATMKAALFDEINYALSQLLHGEQAALQLCGQLTNVCPTTDEKYYAAQQTADEARHTEVFARFLAEKMGKIYPINPVVKELLDKLLAAEGYALKTLGMQTLFEGVAMGVFSGLRMTMSNPLLVDLVRRVELDESRHAAFGVITMRQVVEQCDAQEREEMEDWAFEILETLNAAQQLDMLQTLGPEYGIDAARLTKHVVGLAEFPMFNSQVYMHTVVPNLQRLGLITERTEGRYRELGILSDIRAQADSPASA